MSAERLFLTKRLQFDMQSFVRVEDKQVDITLQSFFQIFLGVGSVIIALSFLFIRLRGSNKPITLKKIIIPPIGMSTGFLMFLYSPMRIPWEWGVVAFFIGAIFLSFPLIKTTRLVEIDGEVFVKRSKSFILILIGLLIVRISLHKYIEHLISVEQTGSIFFILAFGMIVPWRAAMLWQYQNMPKRHRLLRGNVK